MATPSTLFCLYQLSKKPAGITSEIPTTGIPITKIPTNDIKCAHKGANAGAQFAARPVARAIAKAINYSYDYRNMYRIKKAKKQSPRAYEDILKKINKELMQLFHHDFIDALYEFMKTPSDMANAELSTFDLHRKTISNAVFELAAAASFEEELRFSLENKAYYMNATRRFQMTIDTIYDLGLRSQLIASVTKSTAKLTRECSLGKNSVDNIKAELARSESVGKPRRCSRAIRKVIPKVAVVAAYNANRCDNKELFATAFASAATLIACTSKETLSLLKPLN